MNNTTIQHEVLCTQMVSTLFTAALSIISFTSFIGNILVIAIFLKTRSLRTSTNYYIVNMAVSDLLCTCFSWPLYATEGMLARTEFITEPLASVVCKLGMYFRGISQVVSVLSLVLISVDRYVAIVFPLKMTMLCRKRARLTLLVSTWIIPTVSGFPFFLYTKIIKFNDQAFCRTFWSKSLNSIYNGAGFVAFYCAPFVAMIILYTLTIKTLRKRPVSLEDTIKGQINSKRKKRNEKIMKILIAIISGFFICWTPLCVYVALKMFHPELFPQDKCLIVAGLFFYVLPSVSTAINPVILFLFSSNYRQALENLTLRPCGVLRGRQSNASGNRIGSLQINTNETVERQ